MQLLNRQVIGGCNGATPLTVGHSRPGTRPIGVLLGLEVGQTPLRAAKGLPLSQSSAEPIGAAVELVELLGLDLAAFFGEGPTIVAIVHSEILARSVGVARGVHVGHRARGAADIVAELIVCNGLDLEPQL